MFDRRGIPLGAPVPKVNKFICLRGDERVKFYIMNKELSLAELKLKIENDISLPLQESNLVFGEGNENSDVLFIGEAPGFHENEQKRPFVGRSGQLLNKLIEATGWRREDVYITNIVKRRPPENRDPLPEEIEAYRPYLSRQIEIINPKIVATLGRFSMAYFLPDGKISRDQGKVFWWRDTLLMPLYHPAAALRSPNILIPEMQKTFLRLKTVIKKYEELKNEHNRKKQENRTHKQSNLL